MKSVGLAGFVLLFVLLGAIDAKNAGAQKVYSWQEAGGHIGENATVEGRIVLAKNTGKVCYLNFDPDYKKYISITIFSKNFGKFPQPPEAMFKNKDVRVSGPITEYQGRAQIVVEEPSQITIGAAAAKPAPAAQPAAAGGQPESSRAPVAKSNAPIAPEMPAAEAAAGSAPAAAPAATMQPSALGHEYDSAKTVRWDEAHNYLGQTVRTSGKIVRAKNLGFITLLNFTDKYHEFASLVINEGDYGAFPDAPEKLFMGKMVEAAGEVSTYKGDPQIVIRGPQQIRIIDESAQTEQPPAQSGE